MAVKSKKFVFFHVPKTAGVWVLTAMENADIRYRQVHSKFQRHPFDLRRDHVCPSNAHYSKDLFSFCFVRKPVDWYQSFFAYRFKSTKHHKNFPPDLVWDNNIDTFVNNVIDTYGDFVTQLYKYFVGDDCKLVDFIGRKENVTNDLIMALTMAGEKFNKDLIRLTPPQNVVAADQAYKSVIALSPETKRRILDTEHWVMENFYNEEI